MLTHWATLCKNVCKLWWFQGEIIMISGGTMMISGGTVMISEETMMISGRNRS